jgi:very-short-patch-repair endonuclease
MEASKYFKLTGKRPQKSKSKSTPLPKAKQNYLEAEATLKEELTDLAIGFESKFQPIHTKHWRFDFHIVKLRILIEIEGGPWSGGRGGKLANKAWSLDRYDLSEEMGYRIERFHPDAILSGYVINLIKERLARIENGTDQTISTD